MLASALEPTTTRHLAKKNFISYSEFRILNGYAGKEVFIGILTNTNVLIYRQNAYLSAQNELTTVHDIGYYR